MTDRPVTRMARWPFLLGDVLLLSVAAFVIFRSEAPLGVWPAVISLAAVALGAWMCVIPFLREHTAALKLTEADTLATTIGQMEDLEKIRSHISDATSLWHAIQEQAGKTAQNAREISERMSAQMQEFQTFAQRANDQEKNTLRLELDKLKRTEGDWLQVLVRILDFIHALHQAGLRTGQRELISELTQFQNACRDAARRVGLVPFTPAPDDAFDPRLHQPADAQTKPAASARITEVLAPGFTFQAQLLRRAVVRVAQPGLDATRSDHASATAGEGAPAQTEFHPAGAGSSEPESSGGRERPEMLL